jgi:hypothetical protein
LPKGKIQIQISSTLICKLQIHESSITALEVLKQPEPKQEEAPKKRVKFSKENAGSLGTMELPAMLAIGPPESKFEIIDSFGDQVKVEVEKQKDNEFVAVYNPMKRLARKNEKLRKSRKRGVRGVRRFLSEKKSKFHDMSRRKKKVKRMTRMNGKHASVGILTNQQRTQIKKQELLTRNFKQKFLTKKLKNFKSSKEKIYEGKATLFTLTEAITKKAVIAVPFEISLDGAIKPSHDIKTMTHGSKAQYANELKFRKQWNKNKRLTPIMEELFKQVAEHEQGELKVVNVVKGKFEPDNSNFEDFGDKKSVLDDLLDDGSVLDPEEGGGKMVQELEFGLLRGLESKHFSKENSSNFVKGTNTEQSRGMFNCCFRNAKALNFKVEVSLDRLNYRQSDECLNLVVKLPKKIVKDFKYLEVLLISKSIIQKKGMEADSGEHKLIGNELKGKFNQVLKKQKSEKQKFRDPEKQKTGLTSSTLRKLTTFKAGLTSRTTVLFNQNWVNLEKFYFENLKKYKGNSNLSKLGLLDTVIDNFQDSEFITEKLKIPKFELESLGKDYSSNELKNQFRAEYVKIERIIESKSIDLRPKKVNILEQNQLDNFEVICRLDLKKIGIQLENVDMDKFSVDFSLKIFLSRNEILSCDVAVNEYDLMFVKTPKFKNSRKVDRMNWNDIQNRVSGQDNAFLLPFAKVRLEKQFLLDG